MLARELRALSDQPPPQEKPIARPQERPAMMQPVAAAPSHPLPALVKQAPPKRARRKRAAWRNVLVILFSCAVTGAAGQFVLSHGRGKDLNWSQIVAGLKIRAAGGEIQPAAVPPAKITPASLTRASEDALLERAFNQMSHNDGSGGRAVYEVLAHYRSPRGTFSLAETYDPNVLARHPEWGLKPDPRLAREWYSKAVELGSLAAFERLKDLDKLTGSRSKDARS
jgi:hypothetical protein